MGIVTGIAVSGLIASSLRIANAANNIANAESEDFSASDVITKAQENGGVFAEIVARSQNPVFPDVPNVDLSEEIVTTLQASQAYEANAALIKVDKELNEILLDVIYDDE